MADAALISDSETVYRRVPPSEVFLPGEPPQPPWNAFKPREPNPRKLGDRGDVDGLSVDLASLRTAKATSEGTNPSRPYNVVELTVEQIRLAVDSAGTAGMDVVAQPVAGNDAHALIPQLNSIDYNAGGPTKKRITEWAAALAGRCRTIIQASSLRGG